MRLLTLALLIAVAAGAPQFPLNTADIEQIPSASIKSSVIEEGDSSIAKQETKLTLAELIAQNANHETTKITEPTILQNELPPSEVKSPKVDESKSTVKANIEPEITAEQESSLSKIEPTQAAPAIVADKEQESSLTEAKLDEPIIAIDKDQENVPTKTEKNEHIKDADHKPEAIIMEAESPAPTKPIDEKKESGIAKTESPDPTKTIADKKEPDGLVKTESTDPTKTIDEKKESGIEKAESPDPTKTIGDKKESGLVKTESTDPTKTNDEKKESDIAKTELTDPTTTIDEKKESAIAKTESTDPIKPIDEKKETGKTKTGSTTSIKSVDEKKEAGTTKTKSTGPIKSIDEKKETGTAKAISTEPIKPSEDKKESGLVKTESLDPSKPIAEKKESGIAKTESTDPIVAIDEKKESGIAKTEINEPKVVAIEIDEIGMPQSKPTTPNVADENLSEASLIQLDTPVSKPQSTEEAIDTEMMPKSSMIKEVELIEDKTTSKVTDKEMPSEEPLAEITSEKETINEINEINGKSGRSIPFENIENLVLDSEQTMKTDEIKETVDVLIDNTKIESANIVTADISAKVEDTPEKKSMKIDIIKETDVVENIADRPTTMSPEEAMADISEISVQSEPKTNIDIEKGPILFDEPSVDLTDTVDATSLTVEKSEILSESDVAITDGSVSVDIIKEDILTPVEEKQSEISEILAAVTTEIPNTDIKENIKTKISKTASQLNEKKGKPIGKSFDSFSDASIIIESASDLEAEAPKESRTQKESSTIAEVVVKSKSPTAIPKIEIEIETEKAAITLEENEVPQGTIIKEKSLIVKEEGQIEESSPQLSDIIQTENIQSLEKIEIVDKDLPSYKGNVQQKSGIAINEEEIATDNIIDSTLVVDNNDIPVKSASTKDEDLTANGINQSIDEKLDILKISPDTSIMEPILSETDIPQEKVVIKVETKPDVDVAVVDLTPSENVLPQEKVVINVETKPDVDVAVVDLTPSEIVVPQEKVVINVEIKPDVGAEVVDLIPSENVVSQENVALITESSSADIIKKEALPIEELTPSIMDIEEKAIIVLENIVQELPIVIPKEIAVKEMLIAADSPSQTETKASKPVDIQTEKIQVDGEVADSMTAKIDMAILSNENENIGKSILDSSDSTLDNDLSPVSLRNTEITKEEDITIDSLPVEADITEDLNTKQEIKKDGEIHPKKDDNIKLISVLQKDIDIVIPPTINLEVQETPADVVEIMILTDNDMTNEAAIDETDLMNLVPSVIADGVTAGGETSAQITSNTEAHEPVDVFIAITDVVDESAKPAELIKDKDIRPKFKNAPTEAKALIPKKVEGLMELSAVPDKSAVLQKTSVPKKVEIVVEKSPNPKKVTVVEQKAPTTEKVEVVEENLVVIEKLEEVAEEKHSVTDKLEVVKEKLLVPEKIIVLEEASAPIISEGLPVKETMEAIVEKALSPKTVEVMVEESIVPLTVERLVEELPSPEMIEILVEELPVPVKTDILVEGLPTPETAAILVVDSPVPVTTELLEEEVPIPVNTEVLVEESLPISETVGSLVEEPSIPVATEIIEEESPVPVAIELVVKELSAAEMIKVLVEEPSIPVATELLVEELPAPKIAKHLVEESPVAKTTELLVGKSTVPKTIEFLVEESPAPEAVELLVEEVPSAIPIELPVKESHAPEIVDIVSEKSHALEIVDAESKKSPLLKEVKVVEKPNDLKNIQVSVEAAAVPKKVEFVVEERILTKKIIDVTKPSQAAINEPQQKIISNVNVNSFTVGRTAEIKSKDAPTQFTSPLSSFNVIKSGGKSIDSASQLQQIPQSEITIATNPVSRTFGFGTITAHSPIAPPPVLFNGAFVDPRTLVAPRFRQYIYSNDASDIIAAKVALFRLHAALQPKPKVRNTSNFGLF